MATPLYESSSINVINTAATSDGLQEKNTKFNIIIIWQGVH